MRDIICPMKGCDKMLTRNEASINNHLRLSHKTTPEQRLRLRIKMLGDLREANKEKKKARCDAQREKALLKTTGLS